jgi:formyltetrahydrofolate-dependent phosphoribosylglycinamide formyltransferase
MTKIAILISGRGSNMESLVNAINNGKLDAEVCFVGSDDENAKGLQSARDMGIKTLIYSYGANNSLKEKAEETMLRDINEYKVEWLILAGFMRVLSKTFIEHMEGRIVNIHPSLLPSFKGAHAIKDAFQYGVKVTGVTIHFVDEFVDSGTIIAQSAIEIKEDDTIETLSERIHKIEHSLYPATLTKLFTKRSLKNEQ